MHPTLTLLTSRHSAALQDASLHYVCQSTTWYGQGSAQQGRGLAGAGTLLTRSGQGRAGEGRAGQGRAGGREGQGRAGWGAGKGRAGQVRYLQIGGARDGVSLWAGDAAVKGGLLR